MKGKSSLDLWGHVKYATVDPKHEEIKTVASGEAFLREFVP